MAHVRETQDGDLVSLAPSLRAEDLKELEAHKVDAETALRMGMKLSRPCYTIEHNGKPIGMFGSSPHPMVPTVGIVWLLGSDEIASKDVRTRFLRESKEWLDEISTGYDLLCNMVHEENALHIKWLRFLGFNFIRAESPFIEFVRLNPLCVTQQSL
jgi:hypothetical protein